MNISKSFLQQNDIKEVFHQLDASHMLKLTIIDNVVHANEKYITGLLQILTVLF